MKKRFPALVLALVSVLLLTLPCVSAAWAAQDDYEDNYEDEHEDNYEDDYEGDEIAAEHTASNGLPYYIMVNRAQCTVTVYTLDANGYYTVPVKAMICSVGRQGAETPLGTWPLGWKSTWTYMVDGSYGQYTSQIIGGILFHSVCYYWNDPSALMTEEYNGLGAPASLGCVRLQTVDAKWIFDHCAQGTYVTIYDGTDPGALGKPSRLVDYIPLDHPARGWDPTDPRAENPWPAILAAQAFRNEYYGAPLLWAVENSIVLDNSAVLDPGAACTHAQVLTMLWRAAGRPASDAQIPIAAEETAWYAAALRWAAENGMIDGNFQPDAPCSRAGAIWYLWRAVSGPGCAPGFTGVNSGAFFAAATAWVGEDGGAAAGDCTLAQLLTFLYRVYR